MTWPLGFRAVRPVRFAFNVVFRALAGLVLLLTAGTLAQAQTAYFSGAVSVVGSGLSYPTGVAVDAKGDIFVAGNGSVKEIVAVNGVVSSTSQVIVVGSGFDDPAGVAVDAYGNVFVSDTGTNVVKEIVAVNGMVSSSSQVITVASGFNYPNGLALDAHGDVFVADTNNNEVKEIVASNGKVSSSSQVITVASGFDYPNGLALDAFGDVFVADSGHNVVKEIVASNGAVSSTSQVKSLGIGFDGPEAVALDDSGDVFVIDQSNTPVKEIVAVAGAVSSTSQVKILGTGFDYPSGVAVNASGNVLVADHVNSEVKEIQLGSVNLGSVAVGSTVTATLNFVEIGPIAVPKVLTQGATGRDFTDTGSGSCNEYAEIGVAQNQTSSCTVVVKFAPTVPGQRLGAVQLFATGGTTPMASVPIYGTGTGPLVTFPSNAAQTALGGGFSVPQGVAVDGAGNVYEGDFSNSAVKEIPAGCASASCVTALGGGFSGPQGVAVDGAGNVYVADYTNSAVKEIPAGCASASCVTALGGGFFGPSGVAVDGAGNVYVADQATNAVTEMPAGCASASCVTALGGGFVAPVGVAVDGAGNVYVADGGNNAVKEMPAGCASASCVTVLGGGFDDPTGVAVDGAGNIYVADLLNSAVKEMPAGCASASASCVTVLGGGFSFPVGVALDGSGNLYVSDALKNQVLELPFATPPTVTFATSTQDGMTDTTDGTSGVESVTVANIGNEPLGIVPPVIPFGTNPSVASGFSLTTGTGACPVLTFTALPQTLAVGASCTLGIEFAPVAPDNGTVSGSVVLTDTNLNASAPSYSTQSIPLSGKAVGGDTTATTLVSSSNSIGSGGTVNLTATVADTTHTGTVPTGSVIFTDTYGTTTTTLTGSPVALSGGQAQLSATLTGDGVHAITASYVGVSGTYSVSNSTTNVTVGTATHFSVSAASPEYAGGSFPLTVTALDANNQVATLYSGTVSITISNPVETLLPSGTLTNGVGTFTVTLPSVGNVLVIATDTATGTLLGQTTLTVQAPPVFTVTVATDTTSGVATNCTANSTTDANCSLRDAIAAVTALNLPTVTPTIQFSPLLTSGGPVTITEGSAGTLTIGTNMNIVGPGQTLLAIDGANTYGVISVSSGVTASISGVTVQHGNNTQVTGVTAGGIQNGGTLTVTNSSIVHNIAYGSGGGLVNLNGSLTLAGCTVANNTAYNGGGVASEGGALAISGSSITGNAINSASTLQGGGGVWQAGSTVSISNSTISGNTSSGSSAGGLFLDNATGTLTNVTVTGNSAAVFGGGILNYKSSLTLVQTTVVGSSSRTGGGIVNDAAVALVLQNSVVAGNTATTSYPNIEGTVTDNSGNIYDTTITSALNPNLAVLGSYGGSTQTQPGLPGSPVLCAGLLSNVGSLTTDQRGNPRVATYGGNQCVDAGAAQTAYSLAFVQQPGNTETGLTLSPAPAVKLVDNGVANGIPGASIGIALTNGPLSGLSTATTDSTGTATFNGLSIPAAETGDTLTASAAAGTNRISATSNAFNVITVTATQVIASEVLTKGQPSTTFMPVTGSGGTAPLSYSVSPALPAGLSLASSTGAISGSPTVASAATVYTITVTDALNVTGTATFSLTVNPAVAATQAIASTTLTQNHAPAAFRPVTGSGGTGTLSYSISPSLPAGLSFSGSTGAITGTPTATSAVTVYTVTVTDSNNATASATFNLTVNTAVTATQAVASTTVVLNQAATAFTPVTGAGGTGSLGYSVSPALPTGLSFSSTTGAISGTPTVTSSATTYTVTVTDTNGATATATFSLTVILSVPPTVSSVSAVTTTYGATTGVTVTATESGNEGLATGGIVTFGLSGGATGSFSPATCTLSSAGTCTTTFTPTGTLAAGTYTGGITANFALVNSYSAASGSSTLTVNQAAQTITFAPASPVTYGVAPITLAATGGGSGNAIAYTLGSGSPASLTGNLLTITGAGTVTVTANQAGNANYTAASAVTATILVNKATPTVGLTSSVNPVLVQNTITLVATVGGVSLPSGTVSFYDNTAGATIGSAPLISGVASLPTAALAVGTHSITAIYSGDANFVSLTSSPVSEQVDDFNLNISASSSVTTQTVVPGGTATYLLTISPTGTSTFPAAVTLSVSGLPTGATYTITPTTIAAGAGSTSVTLTITPPNAAAKLEGSRWKELAPVTLALLLLPFARRWRRSALRLRRIAYVALLVVAAAGAMAGLSGCGTGNGVFAQAPQTYNVVVTGTSGALTHSTTVTLTVE